MVDPFVKSKKVSLERYPFLHFNDDVGSEEVCERDTPPLRVRRSRNGLQAPSHGFMLESHHFLMAWVQSTPKQADNSSALDGYVDDCKTVSSLLIVALLPLEIHTHVSRLLRI